MVNMTIYAFTASINGQKENYLIKSTVDPLKQQKPNNILQSHFTEWGSTK